MTAKVSEAAARYMGAGFGSDALLPATGDGPSAAVARPRARDALAYLAKNDRVGQLTSITLVTSQ